MLVMECPQDGRIAEEKMISGRNKYVTLTFDQMNESVLDWPNQTADLNPTEQHSSS